MRIYFIFVVMVLMCLGCETCEQVDEYGKCVDSGRCNRSRIDLTWTIATDLDTSFDAEAIEETDLMFTWKDIYDRLNEMHSLYLNRLQQAPKWCEAYSQCEVTNKDWANYWETMVVTARHLLDINTTLLKRLTELQEKPFTRKQKEILLAMVTHLHGQRKLYDKELVMTVEQLQPCLPGISLQELENAAAAYDREAMNAESGRIPEEEEDMEAETESQGMGSEDVLEHLANAIAALQQVPVRN